MASHDLKYPDVVDMLLRCQTDDERQECFENVVNRVAANDNMDTEECRGNLLISLRYVAGYYDKDVARKIQQMLSKFQESGNA
jgi:hypothetical protein